MATHAEHHFVPRFLHEQWHTSPDSKLSSWARFLVGLMLRVPGMVRRIRERGRQVLSAGLDEAPEDYLEVRGVVTEPNLREWVETHMPDALDDLGVVTLPQLVFSAKLNPVLLQATWGIRSVHLARFDLLMGDRPLTVAGAPGASFLVALPISPTKIFLALNDSRTLENVQNRHAGSFVRASNWSMVTTAETYVYSTGEAQATFIARHLRRR